MCHVPAEEAQIGDATRASLLCALRPSHCAPSEPEDVMGIQPFPDTICSIGIDSENEQPVMSVSRHYDGITCPCPSKLLY
jgi:hypothetical protein